MLLPPHLPACLSLVLLPQIYAEGAIRLECDDNIQLHANDYRQKLYDEIERRKAKARRVRSQPKLRARNRMARISSSRITCKTLDFKKNIKI